MSELRIFNPRRVDDLHERARQWIGKQVTVESWHDNVSMRDRYPDDESVGFVREFALDIPESELQKREKRSFWYFDKEFFTVTYVEGLSVRDYPDSWFLPKHGCTVHVGYQLFATKQEAINKALTEAIAARDKIIHRINLLLAES
jgi:hypothetical protein